MQRAFQWFEYDPLDIDEKVAMYCAVFALWMVPLWGGFACVSTTLLASGDLRKDVVKGNQRMCCRTGGGRVTAASYGSLLRFLWQSSPPPYVDWSSMLAPTDSQL
eukprot:COSAG01_NODE_4077_length_5379_cov_16.101894_5_plen_105_part_00